MAAAVGPDDSPELHARDTMEAGDGLCRREAVDVLVHDGPRYVRELLDWGAAFDRDARARRRSDARPRTACAACCTRAMRPAAKSAACCGRGRRSRRASRVLDVAMVLGAARATTACAPAPRSSIAPARCTRSSRRRTLLATGGAGQVFRETTNPAVATGDGMAMAFEAGARVADLEFVQFHPTVLSVAGAPRFLLSEALRGEGGRLVNAAGERFVERYEPAAIWRRATWWRARSSASRSRTGAPVYLSMAHADPDFVRKRFPTIAQACRGVGARPGHRPDSGQPGGPLRDGRRGNRPRRPHVGGRPVRGRRGGLHRRARRQPPGQQLAARGAGVRRARGGGDAGAPAARRLLAAERHGADRRADGEPASRHAPTRCAS